MPFIKIQDKKISTDDICDALHGDLENDLFIQVEMNNGDYQRFTYPRKDKQQFEKDIIKIDKLLVEYCHVDLDGRYTSCCGVENRTHNQ